MIRFTAEGAVVWFAMISNPTKKISYPLDFFLAVAKTAETETDFRRKLIDKGKIEEMTEDECRESGQIHTISMKKRAAGAYSSK